MPVSKKKEVSLVTYADYCLMPDEERCEIIDGVVYSMTPAPGATHQEISGNIFGLLWNFFQGKPCKVFSAPFDVLLPKSDEADERVINVVQPDIMVICDQSKILEKGCRKAPDLVVEILSPSTASKDHLKKRVLYERHGVKEFWLIDPTNRLITRYQQVKDGVFGPAHIFASDAVLEVDLFPGLSVDFSRVFPAEPKKVAEPSRKYRTKKNSGSPKVSAK